MLLKILQVKQGHNHSAKPITNMTNLHSKIPHSTLAYSNFQVQPQLQPQTKPQPQLVVTPSPPIILTPLDCNFVNPIHSMQKHPSYGTNDKQHMLEPPSQKILRRILDNGTETYASAYPGIILKKQSSSQLVSL